MKDGSLAVSRGSKDFSSLYGDLLNSHIITVHLSGQRYRFFVAGFVKAGAAAKRVCIGRTD